MNAGDAFQIPQPGTSLDSHLWVVISDPVLDSERVLIVNFTTLRADSDRACILHPGEHPFVKHETCVSYGGAKVVSIAQLQALLTKGLVRHHRPVTPALLARIRAGAATSTRMKLEHADLLIEQDLLDC